MESRFSWYLSIQLQDWIVSQKPSYPSLMECIIWVQTKLQREGFYGKLTNEDLEDIKNAFEFQTSDIN